MEPIGAYAREGAASTLEQFCEKFSQPFLLLAQGAAALKPTKSTQLGTLERVVLTDGLGNRGDALAENNLMKTLEKFDGTREVPDPKRPLTGAAELQNSPYLVFPLVGGEEELGASRISLGCSSRCDVQVNDESVSAVHAFIRRQGGLCSILDGDSTTGTMVNDEVIEKGEWRALASGDRVTLGFVDLIFLMPTEFYHFVHRLFGK